MRLKSRMMGNYHVRFGNGGGGSDPFANHNHDELSKPKSQGGIGPCTPAMASSLTNHIWSMKELLTYKIAPAPLPPPKRKYRRHLQHVSSTLESKKPVVRLRKGALCSTTG